MEKSSLKNLNEMDVREEGQLIISNRSVDLENTGLGKILMRT